MSIHEIKATKLKALDLYYKLMGLYIIDYNPTVDNFIQAGLTYQDEVLRKLARRQRRRLAVAEAIRAKHLKRIALK